METPLEQPEEELEQRQEKRTKKTEKRQSKDQQKLSLRRDLLRHLIDGTDITQPHAGREFLAWLLDGTHLFSPTLAAQESMYFREGERNVGRRILAEMKLSSPQWTEILKTMEGDENDG